MLMPRQWFREHLPLTPSSARKVQVKGKPLVSPATSRTPLLGSKKVGVAASRLRTLLPEFSPSRSTVSLGLALMVSTALLASKYWKA